MDNLSISLLGSTGSIGTQVLDVCRRLGPENVRISALSGWNNCELLASQCREFNPAIVCIGDESCLNDLRRALDGYKGKIVAGESGLCECAVVQEAERVVVSVAGTPGLMPTLAAIDAGKSIALASKEVLVAAGHLVMEAAAKKRVPILPIDSEHSAIFQCLNGEKIADIDRIFLTASGGAFRNKSVAELKNVTPEEALAHPTWKMGKKVTVDSASLMNKGLEIIEAKWLFGVEADSIEVVIHHQSLIHSMVRFADGSVIAQLGLPDMRLPIQYALLYPERPDTKLPRYDPVSSGDLTFARPDYDRFECLSLAMSAARIGGTLSVAMNAADEVAVASFLNAKIGFLDIPKVISKTMERHNTISRPDIDVIKEVDSESRIIAAEIVSALQNN